MVWTVEFEKRANKQLDKLSPRDAALVVKLLEDISRLTNPRQRGHALTGGLDGLWRYRIGDWRVVARIEDQRIVIVVVAIGHRREVYR